MSEWFPEGVGHSHILGLQLFLEIELPLMQTAELVDLVLVLPTHLDLLAGCVLVLLGELPERLVLCAG